MKIVIFGGSKCSEEYYRYVYTNIKERLIGKDITIITGGATGTMEAVCKAAKENGLKTLAFSLEKWKDYINKYVDETKFYPTEPLRQQAMIENADMFICLEGDIGTLAELFMTWIEAINNDKKIYITGNKNKKMLGSMYKNNYISEYTKKYINIIDLDNISI